MTVEELITAVGFLIARYLHIVCAALLVGGTLFYEMVVPVAVEDMPEGQQLAVMGRSRWVFRWIVWVSCVLLLASGVMSAIRHWNTYSETPAEEQTVTVVDTPTSATQPAVPAAKFKLRSGWWFVAHASTGFIAVLIALSLTLGGTPPARPVQWMRLNLVILMIVIFLGSVAREVRLAITERQQSGQGIRAYFTPGPWAPPRDDGGEKD